MPKKYKYKYFHGTMSDETKHKLQKLAEAMGVSKSSAIAEMVEYGYDSVFGKEEEEQQLFVIKMPKTNLYLSKVLSFNTQNGNNYFHGKFTFSKTIGENELFKCDDLDTIVPNCYRSFVEKAPEPKK